MVAAGPLVIMTIRSASKQGLIDVMRHHHHGLAVLFPQPHQLILQFHARERIEQTERLSSSSTFGSSAKARAMPTRWRMPADSSSG